MPNDVIPVDPKQADLTAQQKDVLRRLLMEKDASGLTKDQLSWFNGWLCERYGLDPWGAPVKYLPQKRWSAEQRCQVPVLVPYFGKECAEQLRSLHGVSILDIEIMSSPDPSVYLLKVKAKCGERTDAATGAVALTKVVWNKQREAYGDPIPLQGEELSNSLLKCETKAKNRVTYSILSMGFFMDQTEAESLIPPPKVVNGDVVDTTTGEVVEKPRVVSPASLAAALARPKPTEDPFPPSESRGDAPTPANGQPVAEVEPATKRKAGYAAVAERGKARTGGVYADWMEKYLKGLDRAEVLGLTLLPVLPANASLAEVKEAVKTLGERVLAVERTIPISSDGPGAGEPD